MGQLVFQATLGGQVNLVGPNTASTFNLNVPAVAGTLVTTGDTGTVTNTMLATSAYTAPGTIGSGTANTGAFTTLSASSTVSGTGFSTYLASPPAIGGTAAAAGAFTTLSASSTVSGTGFSTYLASPPAIGGTAAAAGTFTTLTGSTSVTTPIVKSASSLTFQTNGTTTALTIDTSQNVGIGTTVPTTRLDVSYVPDANWGTANFFDPTSAATNVGGVIAFSGYKTGTSSKAIFAKIQGAKENATSANEAGYLAFLTNSNSAYVERMRIDSSGNLLVGTTSGVTTEKVNFTQTADGPALLAVCSNATQSASGIVYARAARNTTNNSFYAFSYFNTGASAFKFVVADSGNVTNTNNSYGAISDVKLKENIVDATPKLADLMQVKVRNYNLKSDPEHKQLGVIAQELEQVFPAMVEETSDRDAEGNHLGTTTKQVKYSVFVPMLIKAIQELKAINDTQTETINALNARVANLEAK